MKKLILMLCALCTFTFIACESEQVLETENNALQKERSYESWQKVDLNQISPKIDSEQFSYSFSKPLFEEMLEDEALDDFRFYLGVEANVLKITCVGIMKDKSLSPIVIEGNLNILPDYIRQLSNRTEIFNMNLVENTIAKQHMLTTDQTVSYLTNWNAATKNLSGLNDKLSYDGVRIKHYTMDKEAIAFLVNRDYVFGVELFFGLNTENKMTTVFLGSDRNGDILWPSNRDSGVDLITPCPNECGGD